LSEELEERLKQKVRLGVAGVLEGVLSDERVQGLIRRVVVRETFKSGLFMALIFVGLMLLYTSIKVAVSYGWQLDLVAGLALLACGLHYVIRRLR